MAKNNNSKTFLIILAVIVGIILLGGIIGGISCYRLYKIGTTVSSMPTNTPTSTGNWTTYQNSRYGFSLKYPQTFSAQESQNGDGVTLTANEPAITIRAYGSNNASSQTLDEYLNWSRDNLFQESGTRENAKEILAAAVPLGVAALTAKERQWETVPSLTGVLTLTDQVTFLKDDVFYTVQMEIAKADYDEYAAHVFDNILASYQKSELERGQND